MNTHDGNNLDILNKLKRITVITGHYGSGKTNFAVNLALQLKKSGKRVTVVDLDIVNPYFRTADFAELLESAGIDTILPMYANTNLDIPALPAAVNSVFDDESRHVVIDVGGDDAGAIALGRYSNDFTASGYDLLYVINKCRYLTKEPSEALELLRDIEYVSRLKATGLVNNTNLGSMTTADTLLDSLQFADETSRLTGLPVSFSCLSREIAESNSDKLSNIPVFPVDIYVKASWNK